MKWFYMAILGGLLGYVTGKLHVPIDVEIALIIATTVFGYFVAKIVTDDMKE